MSPNNRRRAPPCTTRRSASGCLPPYLLIVFLEKLECAYPILRPSYISEKALSSPHMPPPLVGSVFERKPTSPTTNSKTFSNPGKSGFPAVQHRSKSAFTRGRDDLKRGSASSLPRPTSVPTVVPASDAAGLDRSTPDTPEGDTKPAPSSPDWRQQVSAENERRVANMTEEEREEERKEIMERFGAGVGDILRRAREARERETQRPSPSDATDTQSNTVSSGRHPNASTSSTKRDFADMIETNGGTRTSTLIHVLLLNIVRVDGPTALSPELSHKRPLSRESLHLD